MNENFQDLIYDWNTAAEMPLREGGRKIEFDDETLRDGLQSPSVTDPSLEEKVRILHFMNAIGVDSADIGLPGAGPHVQRSVERLAREIVDEKLNLLPNCAARTIESDIRPIIEVSRRVGIPIEACTFIGSSPIRQFAEEWDLDWIIEQSTKAVRFATAEGLPVMYVTEDTTRAFLNRDVVDTLEDRRVHQVSVLVGHEASALDSCLERLPPFEPKVVQRHLHHVL